MTFSELKDKVKRYRRKERRLECNLFWERLAPGVLDYRNRKLGIYGSGLYVVKAGDIWEVYKCEYDRGDSYLGYIFYSESDLYDFIFCYYKARAEFSYSMSDEEEKQEQHDSIGMPESPIHDTLGLAGLVIVTAGAVSLIAFAVWINSFWAFLFSGACTVLFMMAGIDAVSKMWLDYRLAKRNFEVYKVKKWTEKCLWKLRKGESPESEYRLNGNDQKDYVCVEMLKVQWVNIKKHHFPYDHTPLGETDAWKVVSFNNGEKVVHGIFSDDRMAYI